MRSMLDSCLSLLELFLSTVVHLLFGFYVFSFAVALDLTQALSKALWSHVVVDDDVHVKHEKSRSSSSSNIPPIVLVHGIFGFGKGRLGGLSYFGGAETKDEHVLVPDLGSLTSIHDRACELFYYLKGGRVDFGEEHSSAYGHSRFGNVYEQGHYPLWDEEHPIHFVGHSAGAQVIRMLQQMLADKAFEGHENTSADWVLSVTSLSGALNGTTRAYLDGMSVEDGKSIRTLSLLQVCRLGVIFYDWFNIRWLKKYYNFGFDHFEMEWNRTGLSGLSDLLSGNSGPFATGDWILPDLTIQGALKLNSKLSTFPNTFYFSYASKTTNPALGFRTTAVHPLLFLRSLQMRQWRYPIHVSPPFKAYKDEDWEENDGALNTISMTHPLFPIEHPSLCVVDDFHVHPMKPGIWYYKILEGDHILYVVSRERAGVKFDLLYDGIFERCRKNIIRIKSPLLPNHIG
ncbi:Triacylglycerol lipase protein [Dioscorea alata]|uniref:Triacylglycerol lipase protein n=1 Tax=Dioscorea alata TaxID=55571 RepID=A0ACB7VQL9_DIOAL|nr:Triacylglycerol lipase protein [Dioscorea alata]